MKISCDIIRDLLPLYAEDMVSNASRDMVDEHLCECDECTKELGKLKKKESVPAEVETLAINKVKRGIRFRRILAVVTALLIVTTLVMGMKFFFSARVYLPMEDAIVSVEELENGDIQIHYSLLASGLGNALNPKAPGNWGCICWAHMEDIVFPNKRLKEQRELLLAQGLDPDVTTHTFMYSIYGDNNGITDLQVSKNNFWYINPKDGTAEALIWEGEYSYPTVAFYSVNYHIAYYCGGLAVIMFVLAAVAILLRKRKAGKYVLYASVFAGCVCCSTLIACAGQFVEFYDEFTVNFQRGWFLTVPMFAAAMCAMKMYSLNRQDKGM